MYAEKSVNCWFKDTVEVMATDLLTFLAARTAPVEVLGLGEPTHGEPAFPRARNAILAALVEHGFRSVVLESDRIAALTVDAYAAGGAGDLDEVLATGLSHHLGTVAANRELVEWLRAHNTAAPPGDRVRLHGFDAPLEMMTAAAPGPYLRRLRDYLAGHLGAAVPPVGTELPDERWTDPAAQLDAARSIGRSPEAVALRVLADDLLTLADAHAPALTAAGGLAAWERARLHGTAALGLLRYHAVAADPAPAADRASRMLGVRDALMARNLLEIRAAEQSRGPTLVFAHNRHLQRHPSRWQLAGMDLQWSSAGAIVTALLGDRYVTVAGSLGASAALGLAAPAEDTFEGRLGAATGAGPFFPAAAVPGARVRDDVTPEQGYFPLDAETVTQADGIWHADRFPVAAAAVADRIGRLPGVAELRAGPGTGAPELGWDDRFYFAGEDRMFPFATIVAHDLPGFDDRSRLDRAGTFRLNIEVGRAEFRRLFGYGPEAFAVHRDEIDFAVFDRLLPHPVYAVQGWVSVVNPAEQTGEAVARLLARARERSAGREKRRSRTA